MALNRCCFTGRLTRDPELKYSPDGVPVCRFTLAVDRPTKEREADFIDFVAFRQSAEFVANFLTKGRLAEADGRLQIRDYQKQDGSKGRAVEIIVDRVGALDKPKQTDAPAEAAGEGPEVVYDEK